MSYYVFPEWTETLRRWIGLLVLGAPLYVGVLWAYGLSPETIRIGYRPVQPVPYNHAVHAGELQMDCRYCHSTVEESPKAGIPTAETCMNCHKQIRPESPNLALVREAYDNDAPLAWVRVHDLPDYVYFNHSAHVRRGVGCESCHGRVDLMVEVEQVAPLTMSWCLECHRAPQAHLRPMEDITSMGYVVSPDEGKARQAQRNIDPPTNCSTCHR